MLVPSKIVTDVATQVLTAATVKARLRELTSSQDEVINALIAELRSACQSKLQRAVGVQIRQVAFDTWPEGIQLDFPPLVAVDWIKYYDTAGVLTTLAADQYTVDDFREPAWVVPATDVIWPELRDTINAVRVQFQCGYTEATLPETLRLWMLSNIGHFERNREVFTTGDNGQRTIVDGLIDTYRVFAR